MTRPAQLPLLPLYILAALQDGPLTTQELYQRVPFPVYFQLFRTTIEQLQHHFLVRKIGTLRQTLYELCPQTAPCANGYTDAQFDLVLDLLNLHRTELELSRATHLDRACVHQILAAALQQHLVEMTCVGNLQIYTKHVPTRTGHTI